MNYYMNYTNVTWSNKNSLYGPDPETAAKALKQYVNIGNNLRNDPAILKSTS